MTTPLRRSTTALVVAIALVVTACGGSVASPTSAPSPTASASSSLPAPTVAPSASPTRDEAWAIAIDTLISERERIHPNPYHGIDKATYRAAADDLAAQIPTLTDDQALAGITRLAAMPGWKGRDGHSGIFPFLPEDGTHAYPLRFWRFSDGLVITTARAPYEDLIGSRVTAVAGRPIDEVMALAEPMAPRDNPSNLLAYGPLYMRQSELLAGVGVIDQVGPAVFSVVDRDGTARDVTVEPIPAADDVVWTDALPLILPTRDAMWLRDRAERIWWRFLEDSKTLYVQYNEVMSTGSVPDELLARVAQGGVERVVVDLRNNGGGDNHRYGPLLAALQDPSIDRPGSASRPDRSADVLRGGQLRDRGRGEDGCGLRRRGHGQQPEPVRRRSQVADADDRAGRLHRVELPPEEHRRRPADHDRAGHRGPLLVRRLLQ